VVPVTLAKRIVPTLLVRGRTLVKGQKFDSWRSIGHALQGAKVHARRGVDELLILDIAATAENRGPDLDMVRELTDGCFIPVTVGGGVRSLGDIDALLRAGADKVAIGTGAIECMLELKDAPRRFGSQALVASLDWSDGMGHIRCGTIGLSGGSSARAWAKHYESFGFGEILLSSIDRDGTMAGYDLELIREVAQAVSVPVIASGGCSGYPDMLEAFKAGADACAAGALFAFSDSTPKGAAQFLKANGIEVRA
jgi:cyclase